MKRNVSLLLDQKSWATGNKASERHCQHLQTVVPAGENEEKTGHLIKRFLYNL